MNEQTLQNAWRLHQAGNLAEAERLADLVGILKRRLLAFGTIAELRAEAATAPAVRVTLAGPAAEHAGALTKEPHVRGAEATGPVLTVRVADPASDVPRLVAWLVGRGAAVREVRAEADSLETIYLQHVRGEA